MIAFLMLYLYSYCICVCIFVFTIAHDFVYVCSCIFTTAHRALLLITEYSQDSCNVQYLNICHQLYQVLFRFLFGIVKFSEIIVVPSKTKLLLDEVSLHIPPTVTTYSHNVTIPQLLPLTGSANNEEPTVRLSAPTWPKTDSTQPWFRLRWFLQHGRLNISFLKSF